jgi:hypothetical protein
MHILGHIFHAVGRELGASGEMFAGLDIVVFEDAIKLNFVNEVERPSRSREEKGR